MAFRFLLSDFRFNCLVDLKGGEERVKKKYFLIIGAILIIAAIVAGGFLIWSMRSEMPGIEPSPSPEAVASPVLTPKASVLPTAATETQSDLEGIQGAFAEKYNKPITDVTVTIEQNTGTYAKGGVKFAGEIGGGWWLAYNDGTDWVIVADGNGTVMCDDLEGYDFPTDMVPECWDETTSELIQRE